MLDYGDYQAFLHIIHISDLHYRVDDQKYLKTEIFIRNFANAFRSAHLEPCAAFLDKISADAFNGHDPNALDDMLDFLYWFSNENEFASVGNIWLVDTGDRSAYGEAAALLEAASKFAEFCHALKPSAQMCLYGNHDAWPGTFPACAPLQIDQHCKRLRKLFYSNCFPQGPLKVEIPNTYGQSHIVLSGVNSVCDDALRNVWALGEVGNDPHGVGRDQLGDLKKNLLNGHKDYRILAVHHPVHYPPPRPNLWMSMTNDQEVAEEIVNKPGGGDRLAHMVLSGHTHEVYPQRGALPEDASHHTYFPLSEGQLQLVGGSLAKAASKSDRDACLGGDYVPHQFQILTFFAPPNNSSRKLVMERRIVGRPGGTDPFGFLPNPRNGSTAEPILLNY